MRHGSRTALRGVGALAVNALAVLAACQTPAPAPAQALAAPAEGAEGSLEEAFEPQGLIEDPGAWIPADELLVFKIEVTLGPVRHLDVGSVRLRALLEPPAPAAVQASTGIPEEPRLIGSLETLAKGSYLGHEVVHSYRTRWFEGLAPRLALEETLRGSRTRTREVAVAASPGREGGLRLEYRRDAHCKGCDDEEHVVEGRMLWSDPHHCEDCERPRHHVWRQYEYMPVPDDTVDIVSALYLARRFLASELPETRLHMVNKDELWAVRLRRGETRRIETEAGKFPCVRVLIGPEHVGGDELGEEGQARFEALFGLHGDISLWVDRERGFPVKIEGEVPLGPFDVAVKATLRRRVGG